MSNGLAVTEEGGSPPREVYTPNSRGSSPPKQQARSPVKEVRGRSPQKEILPSSISPSKSESSIVSTILNSTYYEA